MKKLFKILVTATVLSLIATSCGSKEDTSIDVDTTAPLESTESTTAEPVEVVEEEVRDTSFFIKERGETLGLFTMGMSVDDVLEMISTAGFELDTTDESYNFDNSGVGTLKEDQASFDENNITYIIKLKGDITLVLDINKNLSDIIIDHPFDAQTKEDVTNYVNAGKDLILYDGSFNTEAGLNLASSIEDIVKLYGEPVQGVYETDGTDYYIYKLEENLFLTVIVSGLERDFVYRISYSSFAPKEWSSTRTLNEEEKNLLFGEWKIKEFIGFTGVNDNESEFQNYPDGTTVLDSKITILEDNVEYDINIENESKVPDKYLSQINNSFVPSEITVGAEYTPDEFYESHGTMGAFEMDEKFLPTDNVKSVVLKSTDGNYLIVDIFDDSRVIWHMFGCYFEMEKVS